MTRPGEAPAAKEPPGFRGKGCFWWPWPALVVADLWSKAWAFGVMQARAEASGYAHLPEGHRPGHLVFDLGWLRYELVTWGNTGTIWGLGQSATIPLIVLRCAAVVGLFWFVRNTPRAQRLQLGVLGLILAGALGNLYDNFVRADRSVRDFLHFTGDWPFAWDFPAFNVADACITVGAAGLFVLLWRDDRKPKAAQVS